MASLLLLKALLHIKSLERRKKQMSQNANNVSEHVSYKDKPKNSEEICRVCLSGAADIAIFNNVSHPNIAKEIELIALITVHENDAFPKNICRKCFNLLNGCIKFRNMCQRSYNNFSKIHPASNEDSYSASEHYNNDIDQVIDFNTSATQETQTPRVPKRQLGCATCKKKFINMTIYKKHLPTCNPKVQILKRKIKVRSGDAENGNSPKLCDICGKSLSSRYSLAAHRFTHKNIFPYKCDQCPYQGRTMSLLKIHQRTHTGVKPYMCTQCPKSFTTTSNLTKHSLLHSDERPFKCTHCEKAFRIKLDLNNHITVVHLHSAPLECGVCHKKYSHKKGLRSHQVKIHNIRSPKIGRLPAYLLCENQ